MALPPLATGAVQLTDAWVGLVTVAATPVGVPGAVTEPAICTIGCAGGFAGGQARIVVSPLNLPLAASTKDRMRLLSLVNGLAVNVGSLYVPEGTPAPAKITFAA